MEAVEWHCPCAAAFPPSPPLQPLLVCSGTSSVLCSGPTAWKRSSSACGHALPDAIGAGLLRWYGLLHGRCIQALPIPAQAVSVPALNSYALELFRLNFEADGMEASECAVDRTVNLLHCRTLC